jgi:hypothetical protein
MIKWKFEIFEKQQVFSRSWVGNITGKMNHLQYYTELYAFWAFVTFPQWRYPQNHISADTKGLHIMGHSGAALNSLEYF